MKKFILLPSLLLLISGGLFIFLMGRPLKVEPNTELPFDLPAPVRQAIYHASLAPSSHNTQMWQVWVDKPESRLYIAIDKNRLLHIVDPLARESYISLGAFTENLRQSLIAFGYQVQVHIEQNNKALPDSEIIIIVDYQPPAHAIDNHPQENLSIFALRHSDKRPFLEEPLQPSSIEKLTQANPTHIFYFAKNEINGEYLRKNTLLAFEQQGNNLQKRDELAQWLRFSDEEAKEKADGLPAEQLGLSGVKKALYYTFTDREAAKQDNFSKQGVDSFQKQVDGSAGFFVIVGHNSPDEWIRTGMLMQAFWLSATSEQVALHPISQMLEEEPFKSQIQSDLQLRLPVQMIFRAGYVDDYGKNHGIRRPLSEFVFQL